MKNKKYENEIYELHNDIAKLNALLNEYLPEMEDYRQRRKMEQAIIQAKAEIHSQEKFPKMVLASTARYVSSNTEKRVTQKAQQLALEHLSTLDSITRTEMRKGNYSASYEWDTSCWTDVDPEDFAKAIKRLLENYNYEVLAASLVKQKGKIVKIEIIWDWCGKT